MNTDPLQSHQQSKNFLQATLDGLSSHIAVLNEQGEIILVNKAWREFAHQNGFLPEKVSVGVNYLEICEKATGDSSTEAYDFANGIRAVLRGEKDIFTLEYSCHSPEQKRWFVGRVTPISDNGLRYAVVAHENITERKLTKQALQEKEEMYRQFVLPNYEGTYRFEFTKPLPTHLSAPEQTRWIIDYLTVAECNDVFAQMFGYPEASEIIGQSILAIYSDEETTGKVVSDWIANNYTWKNHETFVVITRDNTEKYFSNNLIGITNENNQIVAIWGTQIDITQRKQAENALRESAKRYQDFANSVTDVFFALDKNMRYTFWNKTCEKLLGLTSEMMLGKSYFDFDFNQGYEWIATKYQQVMTNNQSETFEALFSFGEDTIFYIVHAYPTQNGIIVYLRDITEQKRALLALRESEGRYHSVVEAMVEGVVMHQANGEILFSNMAAERILGLTKSQMMGRTSLDPQWQAIHEDGTPFPGETHPAMITLRTGKPIRHVIMGVHKPNGQLTWISINSQPLTRLNEPEPYGVVATFHDITEQKLAEQALTNSEARLNGIVATAMDAIIVIDETQKIILFNPTAERIFGYTNNEIIGQPLTILLPERFRPKHKDHVDMFGKTSVTNRQMGQSVLYGLQKNGQEFPIEASISQAVVNGHQYYTAILRDITKRLALEEQFYQAQKMEAVGLLAGGIAHDFNNLLTPIMMYVDLGLMNSKKENHLHHQLQQIENLASRAKQLTQQILALSRKQLLVVETLQINDVVKDVHSLLERLIGENIHIKMRLQENLPSINADANQLSQILMNLVINARDAMVNGGALELVTTSVTLDKPLAGLPNTIPPDSYIVLSIHDTGIGMDEKTKQRLFEPFYTTKESGHGTGLGLATVYSIVQRHYGYIQFDSEPDQGTTFYIYLPITTEVRVKSEKPGFSSDENIQTCTVLLVEDEEAIRMSLTSALQLYGHQVLEATNGEEALQVASTQTSPIHLLLTDMMMPGINGFELREKMIEIYPDIKVLYMSGYSGDIIERLTLSTQVDFLQKPFRLQKLNEKINSILSTD